MDIERIRDNFPLIDDKIYLGAAGSGPFNLAVYDAVMEYWNRKRYGSSLGGTGHQWFSEKSDITRQEVAKLIGSDTDEVCFISRVVQGVNLVKDIIGFNHPWEKGDNIVMTDQAYPSTGHTFLSLRRKGVEIRVVKNQNGRIMRDDFIKAIDEKTKLVCINRTSVGSGFTYDVKQVSDIAHEKGAYVADDAIQTVGSKAVDVHEDGVDFVFASSYKWQCGPPEAGFLYVPRRLCETLEPSFWSYINLDKGPEVSGMAKFPFGALDHDNIVSYDYPFMKTAERFEMGTTSMSEIWGYDAALKWLNKLGKKNIEKRNMELGSYLAEGLENIGCTVKTPMDLEPDALNTLRHSLIMYTTGSYEGDQKSTKGMGSRKLKVISGPTLKYQAGFGGIRISPHVYNTEEELDEFLKHQKSLL